ncbi:MAG TPA: putative glycolipid-binding domain-containing protein [Acidimicrobiales bacterium]|nr:putative glycolipid-binding domain-containing protein [Acidimicrobiales bacterium]
MPVDNLPTSACWEHSGLRRGFEVAYFSVGAFALRVEGTTTGLQDGEAFVVTYYLELDHEWRTRTARVAAHTVLGLIERVLESDGEGRWRVDGEAASHLDGCLDVDLEASAVTNALPVHRLSLAVGKSEAIPAVYVRLTGEIVERLEQRYARVEDREGCRRYDYEAPAFDFRSRLVYDENGLVVNYPGIAVRAG